MIKTAQTHLQSARVAIDQCADLLAESTPDWEALYSALNAAQRAVAVAEHCASDAPVSSEPPTEPEPMVHAGTAVEPEQPNLPTPEVVHVDEAPMENPAASTVPQALPASGTSLAERLSEQRLDNLKNGLSINNRVRFASLLTEGDVPALLDLCGKLERSDNFEAAQVILLENSGDIDWDDEENGGVEFLSLVRRLFATA